MGMPRTYLRWARLLRNPGARALEHAGLVRGPFLDYHLRNGVTLRVHAGTMDCHVLWDIYVLRPYLEPAPEDLERASEYVVVDCGANLGAYTTKVAQLDRGKVRVYSYEPCPENFALLRRNIEVNGLENVRAFQAAVGGARGRRRLYLSNKFSVMHSVVGGDRGRSVEVAALTLADIVEANALERVDHLKMDVEGAEYEIFQAASDALLKKIRALSLEYHPHPEHDVSQLIERFRDCGFRVERSGSKDTTGVVRAVQEL